jgi:hypothetical protein
MTDDVSLGTVRTIHSRTCPGAEPDSRSIVPFLRSAGGPVALGESAESGSTVGPWRP